MPRETVVVGTRWGSPVRVKVARLDGRVANVHAEYEVMRCRLTLSNLR